MTTSTSTPAPPAQITPSIIRTAVPLAVAQLVAYLASRGLDVGPWRPLLEQAIGWSAGVVYYAAVRVLEVKIRPRWGWLLGTPKAPTYDATAKLDPASPSGESAADASMLPADVPVETVPVVDVPHSSDAKADAAGYEPRHLDKP